MTKKSHHRLCPCGSGKSFSECCKPYFLILGIEPNQVEAQTLLFDWLNIYSMPTARSFIEKCSSYIFRISCYLDDIVNKFLLLDCVKSSPSKEAINKAFLSIKNNALLSILASFSCLSQGLFLQSGILLRSMIEDCFVLIDLYEHKEQTKKFISGKYSTNDLVSRIKNSVPTCLIDWYGYFSRNFVHFGPLHPAPYLPRACYPDNYVLVAGLQNIIRAIVTLHVVLERIHFNQVIRPILWKTVPNEDSIIFNEDSPVFNWAEELGKEVRSHYPPDERKNGFFYDPQEYQTK